jgi:hypothetical protein
MTATAYRANGSRVYGYTYRAAEYCPTCLIENMVTARELAPAARDMSEESALEQLAAASAIDYDDERSYDSDDFPKPIDDRHELTCSDQCETCGGFLGTDNEPSHDSETCPHGDD